MIIATLNAALKIRTGQFSDIAITLRNLCLTGTCRIIIDDSSFTGDFHLQHEGQQ